MSTVASTDQLGTSQSKLQPIKMPQILLQLARLRAPRQNNRLQPRVVIGRGAGGCRAAAAVATAYIASPRRGCGTRTHRVASDRSARSHGVVAAGAHGVVAAGAHGVAAVVVQTERTERLEDT